MYIIMLGAPGTGKGTVSKLLTEEMDVAYISTGDIFREQISKKTELGIEAETYMSKGLLVPDEITIKIVLSRLLKEDVKNKGAILDGFPRTIKQAEALDKFLTEHNMNKKIIAIELEVSDDEIIRRIENRLTCSNRACGEIYNLESKPPKQEGICDVCGSKLKKRIDDNEETIRERLKVYYANSEDLLKFYEKQDKLYAVTQNELKQVVTDIKEYIKKIEGSN